MINIETRIKRRTYIIEIITLLLYASALILIMYYHEPWYDEAQAWLIARDATIHELLTSITHYEGHPPIWHLILMPFAKLGVPFEIGLKSINFTFATTAMGIFIFKAPFNRFIRCTIPFTYFFFYQYGVISRTYSLMMLGFVLSALIYKERNEKPFQFSVALSVICGASAYGMVIAAGISIVWLWEMIGKSFSLNKIKLFLKSKSFRALSVLLVYNILLLLCIYPYNDTYATNAIPKGSNLFFTFFIAPVEATFLNILYNKTINNNINLAAISIILGASLIYLMLYEVARMFKKRVLLIIPYLMFIIFGGIVYFWSHHVGISAMFYMFFFWCCFDERVKTTQTLKAPRLVLGKHIKKVPYQVGKVIIYIMIGISIYWSFSASVNDIFYNYSTGRETAKFIINNKLDKLNILVAWRESVNLSSGDKYYDYNLLQGVNVLPYFDKNIFYNYNKQDNNRCYELHKVEKDESYVKRLIVNNYPDILIGTSYPVFTFNPQVNLDDFALVKSISSNAMWKAVTVEERQLIYMRKDLLKNYPQLKPLKYEDKKIPDK